MVEQAYVYILSNTFHRLYIGITTQIEVRISQQGRSIPRQLHLEVQNWQTRLLRTLCRNRSCDHTGKTTEAMVTHQENPSDRCRESNMEGSKEPLIKSFDSAIVYRQG